LRVLGLFVEVKKKQGARAAGSRPEKESMGEKKEKERVTPGPEELEKQH
jgi:hypothetical protein